jgi:hypothetical protein
VQPSLKLRSEIVLGVFVVLLAGGIALSLATAPQLAPQQLRVAADATLAAPGFVLTDTNSVTALGVSAPLAERTRTQVVHVLYEAPDRVRESGPGPNGQTLAVIVVGARHFSRSGGRWQELAPSPGLGAEAVQTVLSPLKAAAQAVKVERLGDSGYRFLPADLESFVTTILGTSPSQLSSLRLTATVGGDYLVGERVTGVLGHERLEVDISLSAIGSAPPVSVPPTS